MEIERAVQRTKTVSYQILGCRGNKAGPKNGEGDEQFTLLVIVVEWKTFRVHYRMLHMWFYQSLCCTFLGSVWGKPLPVVASSIQSVDVSRSTLHQKPDAYKAQTGSVTGEWWLFFTEIFFELAYELDAI